MSIQLETNLLQEPTQVMSKKPIYSSMAHQVLGAAPLTIMVDSNSMLGAAILKKMIV